MKRFVGKLIHISKEDIGLEKLCEMICILNADSNVCGYENYTCKVRDAYDEKYYIDEHDELYFIRLEEAKDKFSRIGYGYEYEFDLMSYGKGLQELIDDNINGGK